MSWSISLTELLALNKCRFWSKIRLEMPPFSVKTRSLPSDLPLSDVAPLEQYIGTSGGFWKIYQSRLISSQVVSVIYFSYFTLISNTLYHVYAMPMQLGEEYLKFVKWIICNSLITYMHKHCLRVCWGGEGGWWKGIAPVPILSQPEKLIHGADTCICAVDHNQLLASCC